MTPFRVGRLAPIWMRYRKAVPAVGLVVASRIGSYGFSFLRNVMLARLLTKQDFGIAASFGALVSVVEISGRVNFSQLTIQSPQGSNAGFLSTVHLAQFFAGVFSAILLVGLAVPFSRLVDHYNAVYCLFLLGFIPLVSGLTNISYSLDQRQSDFRSSAAVEFIPQLATTLVCYPIATLLPDFRCVVVLALIKAAASVALSQSLSRHSFSLRADWRYWPQIFSWAGPLLLSGIVSSAGQQASQFIIAGFYSLEELATFSTANSVVSVSWFLVASCVSTLVFPYLVKLQRGGREFCVLVRRFLVFASITGLVIFVFFSLFGSRLLLFVYGSKYSDCGPYLVFFAASVWIRMIGMGGSLVSLSRSDTFNELTVNMARLTGLPISALVAYFGASPVFVAGSLLVADFFGSLLALVKLKHRGLLSRAACLSILAFPLVSSALVYSIFLFMDSSMLGEICVTFLVTFAAGYVFFLWSERLE